MMMMMIIKSFTLEKFNNGVCDDTLHIYQILIN